MIEREVRYKINEDIKQQIIKNTEEVERAVICTDIVMGKYGFDSLQKLGYIVRIRNKKGKIYIENKRRLNNNDWLEKKIELKNMKEGYEFLSNLGLEAYLYINRIREERKCKYAKVFIDEVDLLGTYVEFEMEDGHNLSELEKFLRKVNINSNAEPLYGDIFKEKIKDNEFKKEFQLRLQELMEKEATQ